MSEGDECVYTPKPCSGQSAVKKDPNTWFEIKFDEAKDYKVEEIQIKASKDMVIIEGKRKREMSSGSFYREFLVPDDFELRKEAVESTLDSNGLLTIGGPIYKTDEGGSSCEVVESACTRKVSENLQSQQTTKTSQTIIRAVTNFNSVISEQDTANYEDISKEIRVVNKRFETRIIVKEYKAEELVVKVYKNLVIVEGKQTNTKKGFIKKLRIPQEVKPETITSTLSPDGVLTISAPADEQPQHQPQQQQQLVQQSVNNESSRRLEQTEGVISVTSSVSSVTSSQVVTMSSNVQQRSVTQQSSIEVQSVQQKSTNQNESLKNEFTIRPKLDTNTTTQIQTKEQTSKQVKQFVTKVEIKDYKVEEIEVRVTKTHIKIQAHHKTEFSSRSFYKEFTIPSGVKPENISCAMNPNGILTISAPIDEPQSVTPSDSSTSLASNVSTSTQDTTTSTSTSKQHIVQDCTLNPTIDMADETVIKAKETTTNIEEKTKQNYLNDGKKFEVKLPVSEYKPEEIQIRISKHVIIVEGKTKTEFTWSEFTKRISIPQGVKPEKIKSILSPDGTLTISAPIDQDTTDEKNNSTPTSTQVVQQQQQQLDTTQQRQQLDTTQQRQQLDTTQQRQQLDTAQQQQQLDTTQQRQQLDTAQQQQQLDTTQQQRQEETSTSSKTTVQESGAVKKTVITSKTTTRTRIQEECTVSPTIDDENTAPIDDSNFEDVSNQLCRVADDDKFEIKLNVPDYAPEEIQVKITKRTVTITGRSETRDDTKTSTKTFYKKFTIPQGVKPEEITGTLSPEGVLTITTNSTKAIREQQQQLAVTDKKVENKKMTTTKTTSQDVKQEEIQSIKDVNSELNVKDLATTHEDLSKQISTTNEKFEVNLELKDYKREEIQVKIYKNVITIESVQKTTTTTRTVVKKFISIPEGVNPDEITTTLSPSGQLTVTGKVKSTTTSTSINKKTEQSVTQQQQQQQQQQQINQNTQNTRNTQQQINQNTQQQIDQNTSTKNTNTTQQQTKTTTTTKKSIKTKIVSSETLSKYNFDSAKSTVCPALNEGDIFERTVEVSKEYKAEEIEIKMAYNIKDFNWVIVEGKQEMTPENNFKSRSFMKMFTVPAGVKLEDVDCTWDDAGALNFTAPVGKSK